MVAASADQYRRLHEKTAADLYELEEELDSALRKNKYESLSIGCNPELGSVFYKIRDDINRFRFLTFQDFTDFKTVNKDASIDLSIRIGAYLMIAADYQEWGMVRLPER